MEFTGERMTTAIEGEIEFEHFHRYCLARDLCQELDVLDVASGEGYGASILANVARSVTGVDVDSGAIAHARTTYGGETLRFIQGNALDLPLADASVDAVVSFETLEHVREHGRFMAEVKRVLRPGGTLIVSTPERAVYSARGEPVNKYHLLELTVAEFESLLRANFKHVLILSQRAILGSLIVANEGGGPWRSYERRSPEYIEASAGLTRAPFLVAIASDEELSHVPSSVYLDRRRPGEVVAEYLRLSTYRSQAAEMSAEVKRLSDAVATRDAEIMRLNDAVATGEAAVATDDAEIKRLKDALSARGWELSSVKAERDGHIVWLSDERTRLNGQLDDYAVRLAGLQGRFDKVTRSFRWRFVDGLVHFPRTVGRVLRWPFVRVAFHKSGRPRGWFRRSGFQSSAIRVSRETANLTSGERTRDRGQNAEMTSSEATLQTADAAAFVLDRRKATILVVSHEASRTGAPILGLNLVQQLSERYNVISLVLGGGELKDHFRKASAAVHFIDVRRMHNGELDRDIKAMTALYELTFAIVNSVESRGVLQTLKVEGVPTVSLIHEFSAYTRPRSAIPDVIVQSTMTVFSTKITLENAISDFRLYPGSSIYVEPQGKCVVPTRLAGPSETSLEKHRLSSLLRPEGGRRTFLVIGVGSVQLRKGVDLFIECATIIARQPGGERFQFVWIGDGFDPELDGIYSVYLADQIERGQVESQIKIIPPTSEIEVAYRAADILLLPSRLDPLPNVAIDALTFGLPVLCFEKTTGIADFLFKNGLGDHCVAKYLDTHDLARKVKALADSDELRAAVSSRSRTAAEHDYDMNAYVSQIEAIALRAVGNETRIRREVKIISLSQKFRSDFFKDEAVKALSEEKTIENYLVRVALGTGIRKPMPGFHPTVYSRRQDSEIWRDTDPFVDFLQKGLPEGPWLQRVIQKQARRKPMPNAELRVAMHLHAFYPDRVAGILERLNLNASAPDLFISVVTSDAAAEVRQALSGYRGRLVDLEITPNLGRDIGPFLAQFGRTLCTSYDIIGHLHTKKSPQVVDRAFAEAWNIFLLENLLGGEHGGAMLDLILDSMATDPQIGAVFPDDPYVVSWTKNRKYAEEIVGRMGCGALPEELNFPIGSMFWVRSSVLSKFVELELRWDDFAPEPLPIDGTLIHAIERLFGVVPAEIGMTCAVTNVRGLTR